MSGYKYSNWGRRGRDCGSQGGGGNQNSGYWNSHYNKYENYNQYHYPQLTYPKQWNPVHWNNPDQYTGAYGREQLTRNKCAPRHSFSPSQGHSKANGHSSSVKVKTSQSVPRNSNRKREGQGHSKANGHSSSVKVKNSQLVPRNSNRKQEGHFSSARNKSSLQWKVTSPPLGSEEARKKTLAQATDKIKSCLLSFRNEKSEVLENLLSNKEQEVAGLAKANPVRLEKSDYAELRLTPSDLKVIGMVTTSGTGPSSEMEETGNYTVQTISANEFIGSSSTAEMVVPSSGDVFCTFSTRNTELLDNVDRGNMCSSLERETGLKDSSKSIGPEPHYIYEQSRYTSENNYQRQPATGEDQASYSDPCAQSRSASLGISDAVDDFNEPSDGTNKKISYEHPFHNNQNEPKETLKNLKQRIIQQFLKMGKNNLKDLINNPRSRKFEFAMNHLMKEHRLLLSRELRGLAQSRIKGQDVENQGHSKPIHETNSLLDTDIEINLSHLPQEVIEQLGSLLQLDLLDNAESIDFQPMTVDSESSVHDLQNIQALQVALLSEENIKTEVTESEIKLLVRGEVSGNTVDESEGERNLVEVQSVPDCHLSRSLIDAGTGQTEDVLRREMECERELRLEESATAKKPRRESDKWLNYIPLGKGFMNMSVECGDMFLGYPDFMGMGSTESQAVPGKNRNMTHIPCTRQTDEEADEHLKLETDQHPVTSDKPLNSEVALEANEAHVRPTHELTDCNFPQEVYVMPSEILSSEVDVSSNKYLSNTSTEKSGIKGFATNCSTICDIVESCSEEKWSDPSQQEGFDSRHTTDDIGDIISVSAVASDVQAEDVLEGSKHAVEPPEGSFITGGHVKGSKYSFELLTDNEEPLQGAAATDKPLEGSSKPTNTVFADGVNNLNALVTGITGVMTIATDDAGLGENEIKAEDLRLSEEKCITAIIDRASVPSERLNRDSNFVGKHTEHIQTNLNASDSDKNLNLRINGNEENTCSVEGETLNKEPDTNQNESVSSGVSAVGDLSSKTVGTSLVLSSNNAENTDFDEDFMSNKKSIHSATAEHNIHSNDDTEIATSGFFNEAEIAPSRGVQGSVVVDGLPGVLCNMSVAEYSSAVGETQVADSADSDIKVVTHVPVSEKTEKLDGNGLGTVKSYVPDEDGCRENRSHAAEVSVQFELSSSDVASNHETHDDILEICRSNVVVKTEKVDGAAKEETSQIKEKVQHEGNNDASAVFPQPQNVDSFSQTHSPVICNPTKEVTTVEVGTQAQLPEELDSFDVQKILQLLEKSHKLSPQLVKSLTDHFLSSKVTERCELSELSNSIESVGAKQFATTSVSKEKSPPCLTIQPLNSEVLQSSHIHISKIHDMDSALATKPLQHTSRLLYPMDGTGPSFQGPSLHVHKEGKNTRKQIKLVKPDDTNLELDRVQRVGGGSKDSEGSAFVSDLGITDTSNPSAGIARCTCIDNDLNGDGVNHLNIGKHFQGSTVSSNNKCVFLKMLEIDKEIQKLMEMKLKLYTKLQLSLATGAACTNMNCRHSPQLVGLQCASSAEVVASDALYNRMTMGNNSNTQQMHMGFVTVSNNKSARSSCTSDTATLASTPMVTLPVDYVAADLQNAHLSLPKHNQNESVRTTDTAVMEANCHRGEDSTVIHYSGHSDQSEIVGGGDDAPSLKSKLDQVDSDGANKVRRYLAPRLSGYWRESQQSERNSSSPKAMSLKKQILKPKHNLGKEGYPGDKKKQSHEQYMTGISMKNESCGPVGNEGKEGIGSSSASTIKKPVGSNSLIRTAIKELRSRNKHTMQRVGNIKFEQEFSQSDSNIMVEERKETLSPVRTKVLAKSNKQSETDSVTSCNTSTRHSPRNRSVRKSIEQLSSQTCNGVFRYRGDAKMSHKDVEIQLEGAADTVCSRKKMQSPKGKSFVSFDKSEGPDCVSRITHKRKLTLKTDIVGDEYVPGSQEEPVESRRRQSFSRTCAIQEMEPGVVGENAAEMSTRMKGRVKIEQKDAVDESTLPARQRKKRVVSNSGYMQKGNNREVQSSPEILPSDLSSRTKQRIDGVQKRKSHATEGPPSKVQHLDLKLNPLQWNIQNCFVMVKPLAVEEVDNANKPQEELITVDSLNKQRIQRSSNILHEHSLTDFMERVKKGTVSKRQDLICKLDDPHRVVFPDVVDTELNGVEGCSSLQDPLGCIPTAQVQVPEVAIEPNESITSSTWQLLPDLTVQSHSPGHLAGQCILPEIAVKDENSISTLVSDTSDGEQYIAGRNKNDETNEADVLTHGADGKDDWDRDSACSYDTTQEGREVINSKEHKHKSSKKHKKDRKSDGMERLVFESHKGPVLDIKSVGRHVLAASEDGSVYCYSLKSGKFKRKFEGHNGAVTCLCVTEYSNSSMNSELEAAEQLSPDSFFSGSLDGQLRSFGFKTGELVQNAVDVGSPVQCMDHNCGIIYIGTQAGEVARYNIKISSLMGEPIKIGRESILTLKATKEGPRQVLIIGSRNKPIAVRDAATGLLLRTVCNNWSHTVYSLVLSTSLVYCGTKTGTIPTFEFTSGDEVCRFQAAAGVVCLRVYNNLLFAGCYDGNIYVFSIHDKTQVACIVGPGKMLLCMDIVKNRIIAGSKDGSKLEAWVFPQEIRNHLREATHR